MDIYKEGEKKLGNGACFQLQLNSALHMNFAC